MNKSWHDNSANITFVHLNPQAGHNTGEVYRWLGEHVRGEYILTPWFVGFENAAEATLFKLGFKL